MAIVSTELEVQDITTLPKRTASGIDPDTDFVLGVEENGVAYKADIEDLGQSIVQGAKSNLLGRNQTVASALMMLREETNEKIKESYGAPLVATTILEMTDKKRVYVYTGDESGMLTNRWYYWNGSEWEAGGLYFSGVIATDDSLSMHNVPADSKAVGDALDEVNTELSSIADDVEQLQEDSSGYAASTSIAPEYSPSGIYAIGDYCMHDGTLYRCTTAISTAEAWNSSHWTADNVKNIADGLKGDVSDLKDDLWLLEDEIPDTTQTYTFSGGSVSQVTHTRNNVVIRTDAFTYAANSITEVRTLNTGESLTIVTNLTTLETTVTYNEAEPYEVVYSVTDAVQGAWLYSNGYYLNNGRTDRAGSKMLGYTPQIGDIIRVEDSQRRYKFTTGTGESNYRITSTDDLIVDQTALATLKTILYVKVDSSAFTNDDLAFINQNTHVYRQVS